MKRSELIKNRFKEVVQNGELMMGHEIEILEFILQRLNPITVADYARKENISFNGAKEIIKKGKEANFSFGSQKFVITNN